MMQRDDQLLLAAVKELDEGYEIFSDQFIAEHALSHEECIWLRRQLAIGARIMITAMSDLGSVAGRAMMIEMMDM